MTTTKQNILNHSQAITVYRDAFDKWAKKYLKKKAMDVVIIPDDDPPPKLEEFIINLK